MTQSDGPASTPHVLVVDDDDMVRDTIVDWLHAAGLRTTSVASIPPALEVLRADVVDVLLADYNLAPGVTGVHLALEARTLLPHLPVVFVTGNPAALDDDTAVQGAVVVTKSAGLAPVVKAVRAVLNKGAPNV